MSDPTLPTGHSPDPILGILNSLGVLRLSSDGTAIMRPDGTTVAQIAPSPTADPPPGIYGPSQSISLSIADDLVNIIYFTLDGTDPNPDSSIYTPGDTIDAIGDTEIRVVVHRLGMIDSRAESFIYVIENGTAATPVLTPDSAVVSVEDPAHVVITAASPGSVIYYTLDGSEPTEGSPVYTIPIVVSDNTVISAKAYAVGYAPSDVGQGNYTTTG